MVGGYKIVDFTKIPITLGEAVKIEGIYTEIYNTSKVILFTNVVIEGVESTTVPVIFIKGETLQALTNIGDGVTITITADDYVTFQSV
jgi:glutaredoxin